jgi:hypothetical protein
MLPISNSPIPLDPSFLRLHSRQRAETELRRIVRSVKFELIERESAVHLLGPEMSYHEVDPYLQGHLDEMGVGREDILSYLSHSGRIDICFEDSWTGYFIADRFEKNRRGDDLTIIHLDDHTDMMATLLYLSGDALVDPTNGATFDPKCSSDWRSAIYSGAINIGNYMTPLFYSGSHVHICHVNNSPEQTDFRWIVREACQYSLIPEKKFATIAKLDSPSPRAVGSYRAASSPDQVLHQNSPGWTIVHIDLDYFINDFNGAHRGTGYTPQPALRTTAAGKLECFFAALAKAEINVDRWIIATSPGFCSAYHWKWLLLEIELNIEEYEGRSVIDRASRCQRANPARG